MGKLKENLKKRDQDIAHGNWPKLELLGKDPLKWELLYYQLLGMVQEGRETARMISASPTVREFGECVFALFNPVGESIAFSRGILLHMASMGASIKWMIENNYEELVGFNDGDIFYNNDPHIGGAHSADQAVLLPVYHDGKLIAWVGGLTHCMEVGGHEPGGMSPSALSRYDDGQMVPCMRVGVHNEFFHDFHVMAKRNTRDGRWWILDDRAKLAGCLKMKKGLLKLIEEVGSEYFTQACAEMIESGRQFAVNKLKTMLFPGRYRSVAFYDIVNSVQPIRMPYDYLTALPCEMEVAKDGQLSIDYEGVSSSGYHANNSSMCSSVGNHIYTLLQDCLADGFFNQGLVYSFNLAIREGACINPEIEKACSSWLTIVAAMCGGFSPVITRACYAKGYREEGFASKPSNSGVFAGGIDKNGSQYSVYNFETNCSGQSAQCSLDGIGAAQSVWNPEVNMSDCETFEHIWPLMWLGRGLWKDGMGAGKHRGGAGVESLYVIEDEPRHIESGTSGSNDNVFVSPGIFGGYPAPSKYRYSYINTNYKEVVANKGQLPHREGDDPTNPDFAKMLKGTLLRTPGQSSSRTFGHYDIIHQTTGGGGGWGDPIERPIAEVAKDLEDGFISLKTASGIYCVTIDPATGEANAEKSAKRREEERRARIQRAIPVKEFIAAQRKKILAGELSDIAKKTYNDCFATSPKFLAEYKAQWGLPESFTKF